MEIKDYKLSKETSALVTCVEELNTLTYNICDTLELIYSEDEVAEPGGEIDRGKIGSEIFEALDVIRRELYTIIEREVREKLCAKVTGKGIKEI